MSVAGAMSASLDLTLAALADPHRRQVVDLLRALQQRHRLGYLFISHDLRVVRALAHRILVLKDGQVVEQGEVPLWQAASKESQFRLEPAVP